MMQDFEKPDRKEAILNAAELLFSDTGYDSTSTRAIAAKAGVNMAMLNYYFGSKDGLYRAVLERRLVFDSDRGMQPPDATAEGRLEKWISDHTEAVLSNVEFQRLIYRELSLQQRSDMTDFITNGLMMNVNELKRILLDGIEKGFFRPVDIELTVSSILGTSYFLVNSSAISGKIFGKDLQNSQIIQTEVKPRLKKHLLALITSSLAL